MSKDDYLAMLVEMMERRDALTKAIDALYWALRSGVLNDPPLPKESNDQSANGTSPQPPNLSTEERQQQSKET